MLYMASRIRICMWTFNLSRSDDKAKPHKLVLNNLPVFQGSHYVYKSVVKDPKESKNRWRCCV